LANPIDYVYFAGKRIARVNASNTVYYYFDNHLGSSRAIVQDGVTPTLCYDADFYPYGIERTPYTNTCSQNYKFTGKERDSESGLDNFGARYDSSQYGRFMTPDDIGPGQHPEDPQTWNMYSYVRNNPLNLTDPTGQYICDGSMTQTMCDRFQSGLDKAQQGADALKSRYGADSDQYKNAQSAIDAYGEEGVNNGITIRSGITNPGYVAETSHGNSVSPTADNPTGQNVTVTLNLRDYAGALGDPILESHEGSHVADFSAWFGCGQCASRDITKAESERRAYNVTSNLAQGLGYNLYYLNSHTGNGAYVLWSASQSWNQGYANTNIQSVIRNEYTDTNKKLDAFRTNTVLRM